MKRSILSSILLFPGILLFGQLPMIHSPTIIPANPGINDAIKIVTHLETPNSAFGVDKQFTVTPSSKTITLYLCYSEGMPTVVMHHIDTFAIGKLASGIYTVQLNAYMSSAGQHCARVDSNFSSFTFPVSGPLGAIDYSSAHSTKIYPNPARDHIVIETQEKASARIFSIQGQLVGAAEISAPAPLSTQGIGSGMYLVEIIYSERREIHKLVISP